MHMLLLVGEFVVGWVAGRGPFPRAGNPLRYRGRVLLFNFNFEGSFGARLGRGWDARARGGGPVLEDFLGRVRPTRSFLWRPFHHLRCRWTSFSQLVPRPPCPLICAVGVGGSGSRLGMGLGMAETEDGAPFGESGPRTVGSGTRTGESGTRTGGKGSQLVFHCPRTVFHCPGPVVSGPRSVFRSPRSMFRLPRSAFRSARLGSNGTYAGVSGTQRVRGHEIEGRGGASEQHRCRLRTYRVVPVCAGVGALKRNRGMDTVLR